MEKYILSIDQSTSGTKALLFDETSDIICRTDIAHRQYVNERGWVEHDPMEIYRNTIAAVGKVIESAGIDKNRIIGAGVCNQRETALVWDKKTGLPVYNAIVWQCGRGEAICAELREYGYAEQVKTISGLPLSPYFSAAKISWVLKNIKNIRQKELCCGTIDSWLIYRLTGNFRTDYSNASRTQLFDLQRLQWSDTLCRWFDIPPEALPALTESDGYFGETDFDGLLDRPIPIHAVLGDSHSALYGQGCHQPGMAKATYGTGSSIMMNTGKVLITSDAAASSLAWCINGEANYVLEGNINYTGGIIKWLVEDLQLLASPKEASALAQQAKQVDGLYLVPAFSGLGAPYWEENARGLICGLDRSCGKFELVRAAEESIAYQIADVIEAMEKSAGTRLGQLRVDGGPTRDAFLMQFQADIIGIPVAVPTFEELSATGVAYLAGIRLGLYQAGDLFNRAPAKCYIPQMDAGMRSKLLSGWKDAVARAICRK